MSDVELESELVEFKVILDSVWHNEPPKFQVLLDGELIESGVVSEKEENGEEKSHSHQGDDLRFMQGSQRPELRLCLPA